MYYFYTMFSLFLNLTYVRMENCSYRHRQTRVIMYQVKVILVSPSLLRVHHGSARQILKRPVVWFLEGQTRQGLVGEYYKDCRQVLINVSTEVLGTVS